MWTTLSMETLGMRMTAIILVPWSGCCSPSFFVCLHSSSIRNQQTDPHRVAPFTRPTCSSVAKSCVTLCHPMDCSTPGSPVLSYLPEFAQIHVLWVSDAIYLSHPLSLIFCLQSFPAIRVSWLFTSSGQNIGASASASVLPMNIQGWFL